MICVQLLIKYLRVNDLFVGDKHGVGQVMDLWEMDKRKIKEEFMRNQKKK